MSNLFDRIKQTVRKLRPPRLPHEVTEEEIEWREEEETPDIAMPKSSYLQEAEATSIIRKAARNRVLVIITYNNVIRQVEPYSFRHGDHGLLFFGHDLSRNNTRSYYINRTQEVKLSDIPFNPRWYIEID